MSTLTDFLAEHPVNDLQKEVVVSSRLAEHPFLVRGVSAEEIESYGRLCRKQEKGGSVFDAAKCNLLLVLNHCTVPDFRSVELLENCGCATPEESVNQTLKAGEIAYLAKAIYELSGYGESLTALKEQVKN